MQAIVYPLLPENLQEEIRLYTETEFNDYIFDNAQMKATSTNEINSLYNDDKFDPRDGNLVKAADELSALIEADIAIKNGSIHDEFEFAKSKLKKKYIKIDKIGTLDVGELFNSFWELWGRFKNFWLYTCIRTNHSGDRLQFRFGIEVCPLF